METVTIPFDVVAPRPEFEASFHGRAREGAARLVTSRIAFVGLARNCATHLAANLKRLEQLVTGCRGWRLHIEANDCEDETPQVLTDFCRKHKQATFHYQLLGRKQFSAEFSGPRTIALAEYRDACQRWVARVAGDCDYVVVIDWDQWGGWSHEGFLNGLGWMIELQGAYGMASVSLLQNPTLTMDKGKNPVIVPAWLHYDAWALRLNSYWDDYTNGQGGWKHQWLPPVGSDPVRVCSAFGGMAIYRREAFLKGTYDGVKDCEHVAFHHSIARATGQSLYLCPSMRTVMRWLPEASNGSRRHGDD